MDPATLAAAAAVVSAAAAGLSLVALIVSVWLQWNGGRPRVEVEGAVHTLVTRTSFGTPRFGIDVRNVGSVPVVVTSIGVVFRDGELGTLPDAETLLGERILPKRLEPGDALSLSNPMGPVAEAHASRGIAGVYARTAAGRMYRGRNTAKLESFEPSVTRGSS